MMLRKEELNQPGWAKKSYITPKEAVIYGLVHAVKEFKLPQGHQITQI
jgi:hypothetical protein